MSQSIDYVIVPCLTQWGIVTGIVNLYIECGHLLKRRSCSLKTGGPITKMVFEAFLSDIMDSWSRISPAICPQGLLLQKLHGRTMTGLSVYDNDQSMISMTKNKKFTVLCKIREICEFGSQDPLLHGNCPDLFISEWFLFNILADNSATFVAKLKTLLREDHFSSITITFDRLNQKWIGNRLEINSNFICLLRPAKAACGSRI